MDIETWVIIVIEKLPGCRTYLYNKAERTYKENPSRYITQLLLNVDRRLYFGNREDVDKEYLEEIVEGVCKDFPWIQPHRGFILSFLINKATRELGVRELE